MTVSAWHQICTLREDVRTGRLTLDEFAADLNGVRTSESPPVYREATLFFSRTYPTFRKNGWPTGPGIIESTIKIVGKRVKGTEKHWNIQGAEQTLQVVTHLMSDDGSWEASWQPHPVATRA